MMAVNFLFFTRRVFPLAACIAAGSFAQGASEPSERERLLSSFKAETRLLVNQQKSEIADLKAVQKVRGKALEKEINQQRRECFKTASKGSEKRACVYEARARWKAMKQMLSDEMQTRLSEQKVRLKSLEDEHHQKLSEMDSGIKTSGP